MRYYYVDGNGSLRARHSKWEREIECSRNKERVEISEAEASKRFSSLAFEDAKRELENFELFKLRQLDLFSTR